MGNVTVKQRTPNEGYVYFGLRGAFDPDELTERIGISPTSSSREGGRNRQRRLPRTSQWELSTERIVAECIDISQLADEIIAKLEPHSPQIKDAIADLDLYAVLEVVLYFSTDDEVSTPAIGFSNRVLAFLADVNASIDIDTYVIPEDEPPPNQNLDGCTNESNPEQES